MTPDLPGARHIDSGDSHCLLVTKDDALFTWGFGTMGALCNGEDDDVDVPLVRAAPFLLPTLTTNIEPTFGLYRRWMRRRFRGRFGMTA